MALIVQKYGGTSVGSIERIKEVAGKIAEKVRGGNKVAIVVSAMGKTTDELLDMAYKINSNPRKRELDMLLATGEQISISLMAMALQELGFSAHAFTGAQAGIITNKIHSRARISKVESDRVKEVLDRGEVAIVAGFQGITEDEDITTLGRGGSDISAVALAAYLKADVCEIYTDVEGVFTADPRIVDNARLIEKISYEEMSEMASLGAKVMHPRSIDYAKRYDVPIKVSSSFTWNEGTLIMKKGEDEMEKVEVVGVTYDKNVAKVIIKGVPDKPGIAYMLFESLAKKEIPIDMIIQSANREGINDIAFTVEEGDLKEAIKITKDVAEEIKAEGIDYELEIGKISIVGSGITKDPHIPARMFGALAKENINIDMISTSGLRISCLIDERFIEKAVRLLHEEFKLGE